MSHITSFEFGDERYMLKNEIIEKAKQYKKKIASAFVLVDADNIASKIAGSQFVVTKKIDGILVGLYYEAGELFAITTTGKVISNIPCTSEAALLLKNYGLKTALIEAEMYVILEEGRRERVGDVAKALSDKSLYDRILLAPFDIIALDGEEYKSDGYRDTIIKLYSIFSGKLVRPVSYKEFDSINDVISLYKEWVEDGGAEGLVVHSEAPIVYKVKQRHSVDGVIVGFTYGDADNSDCIRDVAIALMREDGLFQVVGVTGTGFTNEQKKELAGILEPLACKSEYIITDSRNIAFQMVKPYVVAEFVAGDYVADGYDGSPKINPLLIYDELNGYIYDGNTSGVSILHLAFVRFRNDKAVDKSDIRISQITDICPFSEYKTSKITGLKKSEVIVRRVFVKGSGDKLMIQKFLVWKTNKEDSLSYPAYVFFYTDFSSGRKEILKRDIKVSSDEKQALEFLENAIAENVKKGWEEQK